MSFRQRYAGATVLRDATILSIAASVLQLLDQLLTVPSRLIWM